MARNYENSETTRYNLLQALDEYTYICDVQGFQRTAVDTFILKEISFINIRKTALPTAYLFQAPMPWSELTREEKCVSQWLEKNHHGIAWTAGDLPYHSLHRILQICTQGVEKIFVKGEQKVQWLKNILPNIIISNIEDLGCPQLEDLPTENRFFCFNHYLCNRRKPACAIQHVAAIRTWLQNYLDNRFGIDVVDNSLACIENK